ncbi:MAG: hypothetical protein A3F72_15340 [Bacteroidetes bacterium RIFCSPLOWO2_12_FULL_35_15]|nr:MAG: hypothetical protein A3F72_15340 [Bacteroidetes bacterium RIFCSPLOWO2_12_FULL_35_15]
MNKRGMSNDCEIIGVLYFGTVNGLTISECSLKISPLAFINQAQVSAPMHATKIVNFSIFKN